MSKKSLKLYQEQIAAIKKQMAAITEDYVQVLAEGLTDGYSVPDMTDEGKPTPAQPGFDL